MIEIQKKITICTALNNKIFKDYGHKTLASFKKNIPLNIDIDLYFEDLAPKKFDNRFNIKELFKLNPKAKDFILKHKANPRISTFNVKAFKKNYIKFCYKVFTICTAARNTSSQFLIWLDLDIKLLKERLLDSKKRPLLNKTNVEKTLTSIYRKRKDIYSLANYRINCNDVDKKKIIEKILKNVINRN